MNKVKHNQLAAFINMNREFYYKLAYSYVHNSNETLVVIQISIVKAFESIKKLYYPLTLKSWFYQIVVHSSVAYLNDSQRSIMVKKDDLLIIPEELEVLVKQTLEKVEKKGQQKNRIWICILSTIVMLILIASIYNIFKFVL